MNRKATVRALRAILDQTETTSEFLQAVVSAIEELYAESDQDWPEGYEGLYSAIEAFEAADD